jgi:uncharacterized protein YjbI with pentapeptide repeats
VADLKKIDPYNVEALEKSLNDSATRVSTIWISFLILSLYLLIAATTVEHRQLLLADPVKLPVLNIDLPIWGFFVLTPILFTIFHVYVLLQVLLLARTAVSYNEALDRSVRSPAANAVMRQRLANTLFAQIFSGSPRERDGWLGWLLKGMAWITLAIAPVVILFAFQVAFLPYHSHLATWMHRLLIFAELAAAFMLWPLVLNARRDFDWHKFKHNFNRYCAFPKSLTVFLLWPLVPKKTWGFDWPMAQQQREFRYLRHQAIPAATFPLFLFFSLFFATFPGEPHINLLSGRPPVSIDCNRWFAHRFDRLDVNHVIFADGKELSRIEKDNGDRGLRTYEGERLRSLRNRNFDCAAFANADLRYFDFSDASMIGAVLDSASLQGTSFGNSQLKGASLKNSKLQGSYLNAAQLQGALLGSAHLQGAFLDNAKFQGAILDSAQLQGASLTNAQLQGASLSQTQLQGASLFSAKLQGAALSNTELQGASLRYADLRGASLSGVWLQGADLLDSSMNSTVISSAHVWRARGAKCQEASITRSTFDETLKPAVSDHETAQSLAAESKNGCVVLRNLDWRTKKRVLDAAVGQTNSPTESPNNYAPAF